MEPTEEDVTFELAVTSRFETLRFPKCDIIRQMEKDKKIRIVAIEPFHYIISEVY